MQPASVYVYVPFDWDCRCKPGAPLVGSINTPATQSSQDLHCIQSICYLFGLCLHCYLLVSWDRGPRAKEPFKI